MVFDLQGFQQTFKENRDMADSIGKLNIASNHVVMMKQPILGRSINYLDALDGFLRESWRQMKQMIKMRLIILLVIA